MSDKSQLKAEIFNVILRHWRITCDFYAKKDQQTWLRKRLRTGKSVKPGDEALKKWTKWSKFTFHSPKTA
ncbi:hypothetical protein LNN92_20890 [Klebsiella variicola subsp. variicola]|nr:hypothetical protein [Klebsiella variicola subsp. variicola]